jgi:hypothetical protein
MKMFPKVITSVVGMTAALAFSAQAQNLLVDPNFAGPGTANPIGNSGIGQGWATFGATLGVTTPTDNGAATSMDAYNNPGNNWNPQGAYQIDTGVVAGDTYTLSVNYMSILGTTYATPVEIQLQFGNEVANAWTQVGTTAAWGFGTPLTTSGNIAALNTWQSGSVSAVAPAGAADFNVYVFFMDNGQTAQENVYFDNASLIAVPEPATIALLGMGLALPLYLIRRRK